MGGHISCGSSQDDLCDYLLEGGYIRSPTIEKVMRAVDRIHYISYTGGLDGPPISIVYRDVAWKSGSLHLSAPCIYAEVVENLVLKPGLSFLNIGSGTGYLSTVVGLFLGPYGVNHGIDISNDALEFSKERLAYFNATSPAMDAYHFCQPVFVKGCGLQLKDCGRQYDRIYCGAAVPDSHKQLMMDLLKVNGILVMPFHDNLVQVVRQSETEWQWNSVLPVSFLTLRPSSASAPELPSISPIRLDEACRSVIRGEVRRVAEMIHPDLVTHHRAPPQPRSENSDSDEEVSPLAVGYRLSPIGDFPDPLGDRISLLFPQFNPRPQRRRSRAKREKFDSGVVMPESDSDSDGSAGGEEADEEMETQTEMTDSTESNGTEDAKSEDASLPPLYSVVMREKLSQLPLPPALIAYLNYYRD